MIFPYLLEEPGILPATTMGVRALAIDCYFRPGRPDKAISSWKRYRSNTREQVLYGRASTLLQLGKIEDAMAALKNAISHILNVAAEPVASGRDRLSAGPQCGNRRLTKHETPKCFARSVVVRFVGWLLLGQPHACTFSYRHLFLSICKSSKGNQYRCFCPETVIPKMPLQ